MRPLGILGGALAGTPAAQPAATFANSRTFTSSGTFTPPPGVTAVMVMCVGGGGGAAYSSDGGNGGVSSFGSLLCAEGGRGASASTGNFTDSFSGTVGPGVIGLIGYRTISAYGGGGSGPGYPGACGAQAIGLCPVTPGTAVSVTVGAAGSGYGPGTSGIVIVRY